MYRILVITDHIGHTDKNSLYALCRAIAEDKLVRNVDVATRGIDVNQRFFSDAPSTRVHATPVTQQFGFNKEGGAFMATTQVDARDYDIILVRLPPPIRPSFLEKLATILPEKRIINSPHGILKTGTKRYLLELQDLCAPIEMINSGDDIFAMNRKFPIVLKPLNDYGGRGVVRIVDGRASGSNIDMPLEDFIDGLQPGYFPVLGMKYLKNVHMGDKRTVVINGNIIGSSLRLPAKDSWMCNVAQGGTSRLDEADKDERRIAKELSERLKKEGVLIFGFDTLVNDEGVRVLSELNTTSVGGLVHMERDDSQDVLNSVVQHLMDYIDLEVYG
jgi:glutathione synthase